jgi:hypothetical protein
MKMKTNRFFLCMLAILFAGFAASSQTTTVPSSGERYGHTLNIGLGVGGYSGYYGYIHHSIPVVHLDYEFDVAKNFTLAPFLNFYSYSNSYYWGNAHYPERYYVYRETVVPVGVKGQYYFDGLLNAGPKWDFYGGASLGFAFVRSYWDNAYNGDRTVYGGAGPLFIDIHLGTEYHFNNRLGAFFDLSSGVSTLGIALH